MASITLDRIADSASLARRYDVSRSTFANWRSRHADFPAPLALPLAINPLFDVRAVDAWLAKRRTPLFITYTFDKD